MKQFMGTKFKRGRRAALLLFSLALIFNLLASIFLSISTPTASALDPRPADPGENLQTLGRECDGIEKTEGFSKPGDSYISGEGQWWECVSMEEALEDSLSCSGNMFYQRVDPKDSSAKLNDWYVSKTAYQDCYSKAKAKVDLVASGTCKEMRRDSDNWHRCEDAQNALKKAVGCENLFQDLHNGYWGPKPEALSKCQQKVEEAGNVQLKNPDGSTTPGSAGSGGDNVDSPTCESGGDLLNWLLCPIFNAVAGIADWLFEQVVQPLLRTTPISTNPDDCHDGRGNCTYVIWSNFRIYGNIFLIIALLVVVFGQSIGGGMIDAYTAKKILPRLVIATVLINLSIYIVAGLVDLTNIIGGSLGSLLTAPLKDAGAFQFTPSGMQQGGILATAGIAVALIAYVGGIPAFGAFFSFALLFLVMPAVLGLLAAFITLILRQAIIAALVLVSPVAFALYTLPNTQQYFRRWWDFLFQALLVYPIVIVFFAVSDILSVTVAGTNKDNLAVGTLSAIIGFTLQFLPLVFIPFAFRLAGGVLGRAHELMTNYHKRGQEAFKGNVNDPWSMRNRQRNKLTNAMMMSREKVVSRGFDRQMHGGRFGMRARLASLQNNDVRRALRNREAAEMKDSLVNFGDDWRYRASFAKELKYKHDTGRKDANGQAIMEDRTGWFGTAAQVDGNGYRVPGTGTQFSAEQVRQSRAFTSSDPSHYQAGLVYEVGKAGDENEFNNILETNERNMREMKVGEQQEGMFIGTVFTHQQLDKAGKNTRITTDPETKQKQYSRDSRNHMREVAETVGSWQLSQMRPRQLEYMKDDVKNARAFLTLQDANASEQAKQSARATQAELAEKTIKIRPLRDAAEAQEVLTNAQLTADSLSARSMPGMPVAEGEGGERISGAQTGAPGKVAQGINEFVALVNPSTPRHNPGQGQFNV